MDEDLAVAFAPRDRRRRDRDDTHAALRQIVRDGDNRGRARLGLAHDAALPDGVASRLELRLHESDKITFVAKLLERRGQRQTQRDERDIGHHEIDGLVHRNGVARVHALVHDDTRILPETPVELALPHVDRVNPDGTTLEEDVGEPARRGADVDRDLPRHVEAEGVERAGQLVATSRDVLGSGVDRELRILGDGRGSAVSSAAIHTHDTGKDERLRALPAGRELALHQELVKPNAFCQRADSRSHSRYCAAMPASFVRAAGVASILGATFVLLGIGISGVVTPNYHATRDLISAAQLGPYGSLVTLGFAGGGALTVVFASLLQRTLPPGSPIGPALLVVRGFGTLLAAALLADIGPTQTASGFLHVAGFVGGTIAFGIGLFFLAGRMNQDESWQRLAPYTVATALASLAVLGLFVGLGPRYVGDSSAPLSSFGGLIQRVVTLITWTWNLVIGGWLLMRPAPSPVQS